MQSSDFMCEKIDRIYAWLLSAFLPAFLTAFVLAFIQSKSPIIVHSCNSDDTLLKDFVTDTCILEPSTQSINNIQQTLLVICFHLHKKLLFIYLHHLQHFLSHIAKSISTRVVGPLYFLFLWSRKIYNIYGVK